jgi:hypothetical protein
MDNPYRQSEMIGWLLQGDPSVRYHVHRDLLDSDESVVQQEQNANPLKGWGKTFLEFQDASGTWGHGLYTPKWTSTFYTLLTLKQIGIPMNPRIEKAIRLILDKGYFRDGGINLWRLSNSEACVTGMFLSIICHFGLNDVRRDGLAKNLVKIQMPDGGWNCRWPKGATHSSFHTTISALEVLCEYEKRLSKNKKAEISAIREKGIEFLLQHKLFRSHRTGRIIDTKMTRFSFPPGWHYDVMRALDHFQDCHHKKDERMKESIELLLSKQGKDGLWKLQQKHSGSVFFDMEETGEPSRWNTLRALRILKWWGEEA